MSVDFLDELEADDEAEIEGDEYPWSINPDWVTLSGISDLAYRIFGILRAHANKADGRRLPFPSQAVLGKILGISSTDPISKAINELRNIGCLTTRQVPSKKGKKTIYKTWMEPHPSVGYVGPKKTSDLYVAGVLDELSATRARRKRGVVRNPSGGRKPTGRTAHP
jgi:hypothetical protein